MSENKSPQRWAFDLTHILNARDGDDRFPIDVKALATDYSHQLYPDDPVTLIKGRPLDGFEGGLFKAPSGKSGWGIIYNSAITSHGRINFTLAHEFGHYLVHRSQFPEGIQCSADDMANWDSEYGQIEQQANEFAATLLMPRDDFERHIASNAQPSFADLAAQPQLLESGQGRAEHGAFVWLKEPCVEETIASDRYGKTYTLLHLGSAPTWRSQNEDEENDEDTYDRMVRRTPGSSWLG